jgi:hypothetical protein
LASAISFTAAGCPLRRHNRAQLQRPCKTPAAARQNGNTAPQNGVNALDGKHIIPVVGILCAPAGIYDAFVPAPAVRKASLKARRQQFLEFILTTCPALRLNPRLGASV